MALMNLHDAFLNADLQLAGMNSSPLVPDPEEFTVSPRGRFERTWVMFLAVLVEAWESEEHAPAREWARSAVPTGRLDALLAQDRTSGPLKANWETRSYMCHRDRREYWDIGRTGVAHSGLAFNLKLHQAFGEVIEAALAATRSAAGD